MKLVLFMLDIDIRRLNKGTGCGRLFILRSDILLREVVLGGRRSRIQWVCSYSVRNYKTSLGSVVVKDEGFSLFGRSLRMNSVLSQAARVIFWL